MCEKLLCEGWSTGHTIFTMSYPLSWVHEDPHHVIQIQMDVDGNNCVTDILGIGPYIAMCLEEKYSITTINDLIGYIIYNGFPNDIDFKEETKFIISVRCAHKVMNYKSTV